MKSFISVFFLVFTLGCGTSREEREEKAQLHIQMGNALYGRGIYHQALAEYLSAEKLNAENSEIQNNLGLTYFMQGHYKLALQHLEKAVRLAPKNSDAKVNLARVLISKKAFAKAQEILKEVFADLIYPNPEKAHFTQGLLYFENRKFAQARESFYRSLQLDKGNCYTATYYGRSLFEMKEFVEAKEAFDRANGLCVKIQMDEAQYFGAITMYRLGQKGKALVEFEQLLKLYPEGKYRDKSRAMADLIKKE